MNVRPEIKFKGVARSCIVMDYKAWNNGTEQFQYCLKIYWERCRPMLSDHLLARSMRESLFFEREVNDVLGFVKVLPEGRKNPLGEWTIEIRGNEC